MKTQIKKITLILLSLFLVSALAACDKIQDAADGAVEAAGEAADAASGYLYPMSQFEKACNQEAVAEAAAYDATSGKPHPIVVLERENPEAGYSVAVNIWLGEESGAVVDAEDDPANVELVACITRISEEFVEACEYEDTEDASKTYTLNLYSASYEVKVFAAASGEALGSTTLDATTDADSCPSSYTFTEGYDTDVSYATAPYTETKEFLESYIQP
jgi:hypothetical protein